MLVGYDENGNRIHISEYKGGSVYCLDGHPLIAKRGDVRMHHFSHRSGCKCRYSSNKGIWHTTFQDRADKDRQEVRMEKDGKVHIADVYVPPYIVEYQHSPISRDDITDRETFYTSLGHLLIWVFDVSTWDYHVLERKKDSVTITKRRGSDYPLYASYHHPITKILDFNKRELLIVTSQKGNRITGIPITLAKYDSIYMKRENSDVRPFHHSL